MKYKLSGKGFYIFFIPVFFVLHGYNENFGQIGFAECMTLLITYWAVTIIIYSTAWLFYRNHLKASLLTAALLSIYFFFGALQDFLKAHLPVLAKYQIIMPAIFIALCSLAVHLKKSKQSFKRVTFFLNILLVIYLSYDTTVLILKSMRPGQEKISVYDSDKKFPYVPCTDCNDPDIYFLLFDEYSSTENLKERFNFDNSALDSFLLQKGFKLLSHSYSNYNFTWFSMSSMLNLNYLTGLKDPDAVTSEDYDQCNELIRNNEVIRYLSSRKYDIVNLSIFNLKGSPSPVETSFIPVKIRLITDQTLFRRVVRDLGWILLTGRFKIKWLTKNSLFEILNINNKILELANQESRLKSGSPRFVYVHLLMPHRPFYYDKDGRLRRAQSLIAEIKGEHIDSYLEYVIYTNGQIRTLVNTIQKNTNNKAVIILMGDHGYRLRSGEPFKNNNLNAVYFPDKNYSLMNDSIGTVNQFRAIFNTLFKQKMAMLKDSTIFLRDKK